MTQLNNRSIFGMYVYVRGSKFKFIMSKDIARSVTLLNNTTAVIIRECLQDMRCQGTTHARTPHTRPYRWQRWAIHGLPGWQGQQPGIMHILKKFGNVLRLKRKRVRSRGSHKQGK